MIVSGCAKENEAEPTKTATPPPVTNYEGEVMFYRYQGGLHHTSLDLWINGVKVAELKQYGYIPYCGSSVGFTLGSTAFQEYNWTSYVHNTMTYVRSGTAFSYPNQGYCNQVIIN